MNNADGCCKSCCSSILTLGLICLFTWLHIRGASTPKLSLLSLNLPVLNTSSSSSLMISNNIQNNSLFFSLKLDNPNKDMGIYYSNFTMSFHYPYNQTSKQPLNQSSEIASIIVPDFYQGHNKKAVKKGTGETRGVNWTEVVALNATNHKLFRVDVSGTVRFKVLKWRTKTRPVSVGGVVLVDQQGFYSTKKGVKLKSAATRRLLYGIGFFPLLLLAIFVRCGFHSL